MWRDPVIAVSQIAKKYNALAATEGPRLLPHGHKVGTKWMFSGIPDNGLSASAWLHLAGPSQGRWFDAGNCAAGEEKGDMLDLLRLKECGGDMAAAVREAKRILGYDDAPPANGQQRRLSEAKKQQRIADAQRALEARERKFELEQAGRERAARALWLGGGPIMGTPAESYLFARGLKPGPAGRWPGSLRYRTDLPHAPSQTRFPALLAAGFNVAGRQCFVHRIWLARRAGRWGKIDYEPPKMALGPVLGNFVPINKGASGKAMGAMPEGEPIYVTEGVEDALVVWMARPEFRIIAAVNLGNIGALVLPPAARRLVIVADRDQKPKAVDTLERVIAKQQARGLQVDLVMPPVGCKDLNDWLLGAKV
jgi:hypothetical protein